MIETSPKKSPRAELRPLGPVDDDGRLAIEDDVEARPRQALAEDPLALGEHGLLERVDDAGKLRIGQVGEQREAGDRIHQLLSTDHGSHGDRRRRNAEATPC